MAKKEFVPSIGPINGRIIKDTIKRYRPKDIFEIRTLYGYSDGKVVTIEIDKSLAEAAMKNIVDAGL